MISYLPDGNSSIGEYAPFADVDFIVTDLDGTLVEGSVPVMKQIGNLLDRLKKRHTRITVATGRTYFGALPRLHELEIEEGMPVALYNGGIVMKHGSRELVYESYVPFYILEKLFQAVDFECSTVFAYTFESNFFVSFDDGSFVTEEVFAWGKDTSEKDVNGMGIHRSETLSSLADRKICAVLVDTKQMPLLEADNLREKIRSWKAVRFTDSGNGFIEIKGAGLNKGVLCNVLKSNKKYSAKKILAIGDNDNDIEMFAGADISVAVANSSNLALEHADYVCRNVSAEGFADMLEVIANAKKYC